MNTQNEFAIPSWNADQFLHEINKLNKRAIKLNCLPLEVVDLGTYEQPDPTYMRQYREGLSLLTFEEIPKITIHRYELKGEPIKLAGWTFVGRLDHVTLPGSVIVNTVPGQVVPQQFFNAEPVCDHCGTARHRNDTFILRHDNGEYTQVGRQCVRDFLGHDPSAIARFLSSLWKFSNSLDNDEWGIGGGGERRVMSFSHETVLATTIAVIRTYGWIPKSVDPINATANKVAYLVTPAYNSEEYDVKRREIARIKWNEESDKQEANDAMNWLATQPDNNEYMHNLHNIYSAESVPVTLFGYWCSLIAAYQKAQERLRLSKAQNKLNEWIGNIKDKLELVVTIDGINYTQSYYGSTAIHRMHDEAGHTLVWFSSTGSEMKEGRKYKIVGTVKKHGEFKDWKQTILTRVRLIEEVEN